MTAFFRDGEVYEANAIDNVLIVYYPVDESDSTLIGLNYTETNEMKMYLENRKMKKIWMPKAEGTLYPMSQIPPGKTHLPNYAWFDYVRPLDKDDIFNWRGKKAGTELKEIKRREAPLQKLNTTGTTQQPSAGSEESSTLSVQEQDTPPAEPSDGTIASPAISTAAQPAGNSNAESDDVESSEQQPS